ncbi:hypothetical protein [Phenylobacterium sp.]|jgi:hypothetical protein|uniref:hypothetical protein n=1 Tax=Phenylobacterium sp. TaxID=1871053 RepID=UPI002F95381E
MRLPLNILIVLACVALSVVVWYASGGRAFVFFLPLLLGLPFVFRRGAGRGRNSP